MMQVGPVAREMHERWLAARARMAGAARVAIVAPVTPDPVAAVPVPPLPAAHVVDLLTTPSWRVVAELVAMKAGCRLRDLVGTGRFPPVCAARHEAIFLIATHMRVTGEMLGGYFDRDRTTIVHSLEKVAKARGLPAVRLKHLPAHSHRSQVAA